MARVQGTRERKNGERGKKGTREQEGTGSRGWNGVPPKTMKMRWVLTSLRDWDSEGHYPRVPLRFTLGYSLAFPPGTLPLGASPLGLTTAYFQGSREWNCVPPETMKMQEQVLRYAQDDNVMGAANFQGRSSTPFAANFAAIPAQDDCLFRVGLLLFFLFPRPSVPCSLLYSYRSASIGSRFAAFHAG